MPADRQTLIPASLEAESSFESYRIGNNGELLAALRQLVGGFEPRVIYLWSAAGGGKTHLLNACCQLARNLQRPHAYLPLTAAQSNNAQLSKISGDAVLCIDDLQAAATHDAWLDALFALYEKLLGGGGAVVVAANSPLAALQLKLKDLESRLSSGGIYQVAPLNETDKFAALNLRARQKGFELSEQVLQFISTYYRRDTASLFSLLERIDNASLIQKRRVTVPFIKTLL